VRRGSKVLQPSQHYLIFKLTVLMTLMCVCWLRVENRWSDFWLGSGQPILWSSPDNTTLGSEGLSLLLQSSALWSGNGQSAPFSRETVKHLLKWFMETDFLDEFERLISFGCVSCVIIGKYTSKLHKWVTAIVVYHLCGHVRMNDLKTLEGTILKLSINITKIGV